MSTTAAKVLLVEDNLDDVHVIVGTLKKSYPDIDLSVVHNGAEALDCIFGTGLIKQQGDSYTPDLVILDLSLPIVSGKEVLKIMRSYSRTRTIPVVVLSSHDEAPVILESYDHGASSYIRKVQNLAQYREAIRGIAANWLGVNERQAKPGEEGAAGYATH